MTRLRGSSAFSLLIDRGAVMGRYPYDAQVHGGGIVCHLSLGMP
ncbi:MAG: hypothetical protein WCB79_04170 [Halobacteriota archaeon]